ncbi:MAG: type II toxin-antitoxin system VapC family toxin [Anaerolineales bacterium]
MISTKDAIWMARQLLALEVKRIIPTEELHSAALIWAERIGHSKTDDPHYLVLSENLAADFWTADSRLMNSVRELGIDWVYCFRGSMSI